jgi:hypothetical protein
MSEVYAIVDVDGYVFQMREAAAKSISSDSNTNENLDQYISLKQMLNLVEEFCLGYDDENRPMLNEETNEQIFETAALWIHDVGLAKLAAQDLVECAWDDKMNEMVFWSKPKTQETKNVRTKSRGKNKKTKGSDSGM